MSCKVLCNCGNIQVILKGQPQESVLCHWYGCDRELPTGTTAEKGTLQPQPPASGRTPVDYQSKEAFSLKTDSSPPAVPATPPTSYRLCLSTSWLQAWGSAGSVLTLDSPSWLLLIRDLSAGESAEGAWTNIRAAIQWPIIATGPDPSRYYPKRLCTCRGCRICRWCPGLRFHGWGTGRGVVR